MTRTRGPFLVEAARGLRARAEAVARAWAELPAGCRGLFLTGLAIVLVIGVAERFVPTQATKTLLDNLHWTIAYSLAAAIAWLGRAAADPVAPGRRPVLAPLALTGYALGQGVWDIQVAIGWNPFPAPSDALFLTLGIGLSLSLAMTLRRQFSGLLRLAAILDAFALTIIAVVAGLLIYLPQQGANTAFQMLVLILYPLGLLTATALAFTLLRHVVRPDRWGWISYVAALFVTGLLWLEWNYLTLIGGLQNGTLYNLCFSLAALWLGLSLVVVQRAEAAAPSGGVRSDTVTRRVPLFVSAGTIILGFVLLLDGTLSAFARAAIVIGSVLIIVVEVLSQQLLLWERGKLFAALLDTHGDLERAVRALEIRNQDYARALATTEAANRAKSMFLANMSHELRTPLNAVIGFAEMMHLDADKLPPALRRYPTNIAEGGHQLLAVIEGILAIAQTDLDAIEAAVEPVSLSQSVGAVLDGFKLAAGNKDIGFTMEIAEDLVVAADHRLLRQALIHLLGNAVKYTPRDGKVAISTEEAGPQIVLRIVDDGPGIDEEEQRAAFEPLARRGAATVSGKGGLGIGLTLSRRFIELQDGELSIRRVHPTGTEVRVSLPRLAAAS